MNSATRTVQALYYYTVLAVCVLTVSIASFVLIRRILIDTVVPQLRVDYYSSSYIPACEAESSSFNAARCEEQKRESEKQRNDEMRRVQAEQYLYGILSVVIASIVAGVHVVFVRPKKTQ